jgi:hypothetical protein
MLHKFSCRSVRRWLLTIMAMLLVVGHVCELTAYASLVLPEQAHEDRSTDGHGHESEIACDPVDAVSNSTSPVQAMVPVLDTPEVLSVASSVPGWLVPPSSIDNSTRLPSRPPLFVLYASLLI